MVPRRRASAQRIKATPGITGWYCPSVHSDDSVRHLDVGSPYPGTEEGPKGLAVRQLKGYASWVQTVLTSLSRRRLIVMSDCKNRLISEDSYLRFQPAQEDNSEGSPEFTEGPRRDLI